MTRPADIPEEIWQAALPHYKAWVEGGFDCHEVIARAIQADRSRARPILGGLTAHQKRVFGFVSAYVDENGISPTYDEIQTQFGLASKSGVHRVVHELAERGAIALLPNRARAITIVATTATQPLPELPVHQSKRRA